MLEIRGAAPGLLDDPLLLEVGGAAPSSALVWRGRFRDDDGFVWRAAAPRSEWLSTAWVPAKATAGPVAALRSLRPVDVDVRVEAPDGAAASRTVTRRLIDDGVRVRRWRDAVAGTLHLPAAPTGAAILIDATTPAAAEAPLLAAALLASRGVLVLVVTGGRGADPVAAAQEQLAAVPGATERVRTFAAADIPLPAGIGLRGEDQPGAVARANAWDALLSRLGARPRAAR
ncbi:MAG: hypothetical protein QOK49_2402 [Baekduia sp.]|jgi:hypothetical protein|nr:hypothetical protein [Baekduia sp.]